MNMQQDKNKTRATPLTARLAIAITAACFALPASSMAAADETAQRPNILFAFADDWGFPHTGIYGDATVKTPNFDRVAREGVLFTHAFVSSPSCTPSRAAVVTGQDFWRLGEGVNLHSTLDKSIPVYTDLLEEAGYHVGFTRKGWGPGQHERGGRTENPAGPRFKNFEHFLSERPDESPFCFWFGSVDPHRGYDPELREEQGVDPDGVRVPAIFPDVPAVRGDLADYYAEVQRFDNEVGEILEKLREMGELDNTIIVISGDHGMPFPRSKGNLYDTGTRVPLAIRWQGVVPQSRQLTDFVNLTDLAPTFLEAAGVAAPAEMTGQSLVKILTSTEEGRVDAGRNRVFFGRERHTQAQEAPNGGGYPMRGIRTDDFLYIRNFDPERWPVGTPDHTRAYTKNGWLGDTDNGPTKIYLWAHRNSPEIKPLYDLSFAKRPAEELYDVRRDPDQIHNLANHPDYAKQLASLREELTQKLRQTGDPRVIGGGEAIDNYIYTGKIPLWPGQKEINRYRPSDES